MTESVHNFYGNRLRLRACGILIEDHSILLVNHSGITAGDFWAPPGGGIEFGEAAEGCVVREWREETGLLVKTCDFMFACELVRHPLHAIELFFRVERLGGQLAIGSDPEAGAPKILQQTKYWQWSQLDAMDKTQLHGMFKLVNKSSEIVRLNGYFKL